MSHTMITRSRRSAPHGQSAVAPTRLETATTVSTGASQPDGEDQDMNTAAGERTGSHHIGVVRGLQSILELAADVKFMSIVMHLYQGDSSLAILPRLFQLSDTVKIVNKSSDGGIGLRTALTGAVRDHGKGYDGSSTTHYQLIKPFITHYLGLRKRERNDLPDGDGEQSELLRLITERCKVLLRVQNEDRGEHYEEENDVINSPHRPEVAGAAPGMSSDNVLTTSDQEVEQGDLEDGLDTAVAAPEMQLGESGDAARHEFEAVLAGLEEPHGGSRGGQLQCMESQIKSVCETSLLTITKGFGTEVPSSLPLTTELSCPTPALSLHTRDIPSPPIGVPDALPETRETANDTHAEAVTVQATSRGNDVAIGRFPSDTAHLRTAVQISNAHTLEPAIDASESSTWGLENQRFENDDDGGEVFKNTDAVRELLTRAPQPTLKETPTTKDINPQTIENCTDMQESQLLSATETMQTQSGDGTVAISMLLLRSILYFITYFPWFLSDVLTMNLVAYKSTASSTLEADQDAITDQWETTSIYGNDSSAIRNTSSSFSAVSTPELGRMADDTPPPSPASPGGRFCNEFDENIRVQENEECEPPLGDLLDDDDDDFDIDSERGDQHRAPDIEIPLPLPGYEDSLRSLTPVLMLDPSPPRTEHSLARSPGFRPTDERQHGHSTPAASRHSTPRQASTTPSSTRPSAAPSTTRTAPIDQLQSARLRHSTSRQASPTSTSSSTRRSAAPLANRREPVDQLQSARSGKEIKASHRQQRRDTARSARRHEQQLADEQREVTARNKDARSHNRLVKQQERAQQQRSSTRAATSNRLTNSIKSVPSLFSRNIYTVLPQDDDDGDDERGRHDNNNTLLRREPNEPRATSDGSDDDTSHERQIFVRFKDGLPAQVLGGTKSGVEYLIDMLDRGDHRMPMFPVGTTSKLLQQGRTGAIIFTMRSRDDVAMFMRHKSRLFRSLSSSDSRRSISIQYKKRPRRWHATETHEAQSPHQSSARTPRSREYMRTSSSSYLDHRDDRSFAHTPNRSKRQARAQDHQSDTTTAIHRRQVFVRVKGRLPDDVLRNNRRPHEFLIATLDGGNTRAPAFPSGTTSELFREGTTGAFVITMRSPADVNDFLQEKSLFFSKLPATDPRRDISIQRKKASPRWQPTGPIRILKRGGAQQRLRADAPSFQPSHAKQSSSISSSSASNTRDQDYQNGDETQQQRRQQPQQSN